MTVKQQPRDAVLYVRQSLDPTGEGLAVARQRRDGRALARNRGLRIVAEHSDNDTSAAGKVSRPGFAAVLADIESGRASVVIAWDVSRLTRNRRDTLRVLELGERYGVTLAFCRGSDMDLSTPAGRLSADILAGVARHEIDLKSDRQRAANAQRRRNGGAAPGPRAFGYADRNTLHPTEAGLLAEVYRQFVAGVTLTSLAKWLTGQGYVTPRGNAWSMQSLRRTLQNSRNGGVFVDEDGKVTGHGTWPPVVPYATWRAAVDIITGRRAGQPRPKRYPLSGLIRCGRCGRTMFSTWAAGGVRAYRCQGVGGCYLRRRAEPVDEWVFGVVEARLARVDLADLLAPDTSGRIAELGAELVSLRGRRRSLARLVASGDLDEDDARTEARDLTRRIDAVDNELAELGRDGVATALAAAPDPVAFWRATQDQPQRRAAIVAALCTVEILANMGHVPASVAVRITPRVAPKRGAATR